MKRLSVLISVTLAVSMMLLAGCGLVGVGQRTVKKKQGKPKIAGRYDFSKNTASDYIPTDWYTWGEAVSDTETAAKVVGHKIFTSRFLDEKYTPVVRMERGFGSVAVIYPNGIVITAVPQKPTDPGMDFAEAVDWINKKRAETSSTIGRAFLQNQGPYTGYVQLPGYNKVEGGEVRYGGRVTWYREGILYTVVAPPEIPQDEVEKIATRAL